MRKKEVLFAAMIGGVIGAVLVMAAELGTALASISDRSTQPASCSAHAAIGRGF